MGDYSLVSCSSSVNQQNQVCQGYAGTNNNTYGTTSQSYHTMHRVDFDFSAGLSSNSIELLVPVQTVGNVPVVRLFFATLQVDTGLSAKNYYVVKNTLPTMV